MTNEKELGTRREDSQYDPPSAEPLATAGHTEPVPTAVWEGTFTLCGIQLRCSVLDNGQRVINAEDIHAWMHALETSPTFSDRSEVERFAKWRQGVVRS